LFMANVRASRFTSRPRTLSAVQMMLGAVVSICRA
jgi:hypothetical protein